MKTLHKLSVATVGATLFALAVPFQESVGAVTLGQYTATLSGANERPIPTTSPATGELIGTLSGSSGSYVFAASTSYSNLTTPPVEGHIHGPATINGTAPVLFPFSFLPNSTAVSGSLVGNPNLTAAQAQELSDGLFYFNIHTTLFPEGEIRGQLQAVPEPAAGVEILAFGVGAIYLARHQHKKSTYLSEKK